MRDREPEPTPAPAGPPAPADAADGSTSSLFQRLYQELHALARVHMARERPWHTLQATALLHEVYLHLTRGGDREWRERDHFFATAARAIRRVLVNHAEARGAAKRGGGAQRISLDDSLQGGAEPAAAGDTVDVLALDEALQRLEAIDPRQCRVVELRFFAGLSVDDTARILGVSPRTVDGDWAMARAWLQQSLDGDAP